jgi:4-hydroxyacetophenone monooxygenase
MATAAKTIDTDYIRRAVELADPNALRVALYQNSGDEEVAALPPAAKMTPEQKALLLDRAADWLADNAGGAQLPEPPDAELRRLMTMVTGLAMTDVEFEARRDLPAFRSFPCAVQWRGEKPDIPEGFRVVIIGSGPAGIVAGVQCELLGLPYTLLERQSEAGGTWTINRYPTCAWTHHPSLTNTALKSFIPGLNISTGARRFAPIFSMCRANMA